MDLAVDFLDRHLFTKYRIYPSGWSEDYWLRQSVSSFLFMYVGAMISYFILCSINFVFIFDRNLMKHPLFLKNQIPREIKRSVTGGFQLVLLALFIVVPEVRGCGKFYTLEEVQAEGFEGMFLIIRDATGLVLFCDCLIYWIHRWLHHRFVYRHIHKQHHIWKIPTPFASYAFHPLDGFLQSLPYHVYPFIFPLNKHAYLVLFFLVNVWTISIHDGDYRVPTVLRPFINGSAHHTDHHLYYNYNYGQYFTLWDRIGGSYRTPSVFEEESGGKIPSKINKKHKLNVNLCT